MEGGREGVWTHADEQSRAEQSRTKEKREKKGDPECDRRATKERLGSRERAGRKL